MHPWSIFLEGLKNWRLNWRKLAAIYLIIYVPLTIFDLFVATRSLKPSLSQVLGGVLHWALDAFVMASLILAVKDQLNAVVSKWSDTLKTATKHFWRYILTLLLYSSVNIVFVVLIAMLIGFLFNSFVQGTGITIAIILAIFSALACIFAVVYCIIRFSLSSTVCILDGTGPVASLKTSRGLIDKKVAGVVGVFCLIFLFSALLFIPVAIFNSIIGASAGNELLTTVYQVLASAVGAPVGVSVMVVLYKKLKEAVN